MDIENSPGALAGLCVSAARDGMGHALCGGGEMCGNCLCCPMLRDHRRERRVAKLTSEHGSGV
jgi:hypothetical protein